jgi:diguanylate cyclase (GGDEF)-like protein/putative nucleotidyltransferase with HDIG domain
VDRTRTKLQDQARLKEKLWAFLSLGVGLLAAGLFCEAGGTVGIYALAAGAILLGSYLMYIVYLSKVDASHKQIKQLSELHLATIESLALAIDAKDQLAQGHTRRVCQYAEELARAADYPEDQMEGLRAAALLHDIGKLAVPEHILNKPGKLSPAEFTKIMVHPVVAADILSNIDFPYEVVPIVKHHHEKFDGTGYPNGLKGKDIPVGARILTIADCYDALNSYRPYRARYTREQAVELMRMEAGRTFDPDLLDTFINVILSLECFVEPVATEPTHSHQLRLPNLDLVSSDAASRRVELAPKTPVEKALRDIAAAQREVLSLYEISQTLGSALRLSDVLPIIAAKLENIANFTTLVIYLAEANLLRAVYVTGKNADALKGVEISIGDGEAGWVAQHRQALIASNPSGEVSRRDLIQPLGVLARVYRSAGIFPLLKEDVLVGALALYSEEECGYSADEVRLLETISGHAAVAVYNALAFERTEESALTDNLTGLPNSRYMYSFFDQERSRADRHGCPLVLMMMDLDGFKRINDTYGHHVGDEILRRTAKIVRRRLRMGDTLIRYAGDEFVAVLHHATHDVVFDLKQRLQSAVDNFAHEVRPGRVARVGISIGHSTYGEDGHEIDELMEVADERMYQDKLLRKRRAHAAVVSGSPARDLH